MSSGVYGCALGECRFCYGSGKTFFLGALGQQVVESRIWVLGFPLEGLGALVRAHRSDDTVGREVAWILRADLIVVDDVGLLEVAADAAYEKRSIAVSSELYPAASTP